MFLKGVRCTGSLLVKQRQHVIRNLSVFSADKEAMLIGEREGNVYEFNWSLCGDNVIPRGDAFQNLSVEKLRKFTEQYTGDENTAIVGKDCMISEVDVDCSYSEFEDLYSKVTESLSHAKNIFVEDASVGSFQKDRTPVRVISDFPLTNLFARNMLVRVPLRDIAHPIVVYVAAHGKFEGSDPAGSVLVDENDDGEIFAHVIFSGMPNITVLRDAVALAKQRLMDHEERQSILLPCDSMVKDNKTAIVFNAGDASRVEGVKSGLIYGAHNNIWSEDGLTSVYGGVIVDKFEATDSNSKKIVASNNGTSISVPSFNLVNHPSVAVFVENGSSVKEIDSAEASKKISNVNSEKFQAFLEKFGTKAYIVGQEKDIVDILSKA